MDAKVINMTVECNDVNPEELKSNMIKIAGKAAGICYMPDDYLSEGIQDEEKAFKRAQDTAKHGHYSTYEHGHISFIINTDKMMAMVLNSLNLYNTSEKSARYTVMKPETELEEQKYNKWKEKFKSLIYAYYGSVYNEKEIEKLAMENARYMISVFTPTSLEYTVPFNRALMMIQWLRKLSDQINFLMSKDIDLFNTYNWFYSRIAKESIELSNIIAKCIGLADNEEILHDHKNMGIELFRTINYYDKIKDIQEDIDYKRIPYISNREEIFSDYYISNYNSSFAEVAQAQRHRTIHYTVDLPLNGQLEVFIPKIIRGSAYEIEWRNDFKELISNNIMPQGTLLDVCEIGRFEDFYLKCKERLCSRAQFEIMEITRDQVVKFAGSSDNLSGMNQSILGSMIRKGNHVNWKIPSTVIVESRCRFPGYVCREPCKIRNDTINYYRNV